MPETGANSPDVATEPAACCAASQHGSASTHCTGGTHTLHPVCCRGTVRHTQVLLVVNVASRCGFTVGHYNELNALVSDLDPAVRGHTGHNCLRRCSVSPCAFQAPPHLYNATCVACSTAVRSCRLPLQLLWGSGARPGGSDPWHLAGCARHRTGVSPGSGQGTPSVTQLYANSTTPPGRVCTRPWHNNVAH